MQKLKWDKASGPDGIPAEYWKAIATTSGGLQWLTTLCNACWKEKLVPTSWKHAFVSTIYKNKGRVHICDNYRPISLLCVAYKIMASLILKRLQDAGAERRLTATQFGFCRERGTTDAIYVVRRHIELAAAGKKSGTTFVALDWRKRV